MKTANKRFHVTMWENGKRIDRYCEVPSIEEVIEIYGLKEPDITGFIIVQEKAEQNQ